MVQELGQGVEDSWFLGDIETQGRVFLTELPNQKQDELQSITLI